MSRWTVLLAALAMCLLVAMGCSKDGVSPVTPTDNGMTANATVNASQTHLWGLYDVYIDIPTQTATAVLNRGAMFSANVVQFVNSPATNLGFTIKETPIGADYIDVDIDVAIKHPFPGMNQYDGYDVRGIFMGNGATGMAYGSGLRYGIAPADQTMLADPVGGNGAPDGYTRWFNKPEFPVSGIMGYTTGKFATPAYDETATLCPFKYFADGLGKDDDLWAFLNIPGKTGVFTAGTTNERNYYLRFPNSVGVK